MNNLTPLQVLILAACAPLMIASIFAWVIGLGHDIAKGEPRQERPGQPDQPYGWEERRP